MSEWIKHLDIVADEGETQETYTVHCVESKRGDSCYSRISDDKFKSVTSQFIKSTWGNVLQFPSSYSYGSQ